jgi:hypothetical protein
MCINFGMLVFSPASILLPDTCGGVSISVTTVSRLAHVTRSRPVGSSVMTLRENIDITE